MKLSAAVFAAVILAYLPVWQWYAARISDRSDEPWGILAIIAVIGFGIREFRLREQSLPREVNKLAIDGRLLVGTGSMALLYLTLFHSAPPIVRSAVAACSLGMLVSSVSTGRLFHSGIFTLLFLSLPLLASLEFYLGYPIRAATAAAAAALLRCAGQHVVRSGAILQYENAAVWIDAPCSGIKMLWAASFFTASLICYFRLSTRRAAALSMLSAFGVFTANLIRSVNLFWLESNAPQYPHVLHAFFGILSFLSFGSVVLFAAYRLSRLKTARISASIPRPVFSSAKFTAVMPAPLIFAAIHAGVFFLTFCRQPAAPTRFIAAGTPSWPSSFAGIRLEELALSEREKAFSRDFPGEIKRYRAGADEVVVRYVETATRSLHPVAHCLRGLGLTVAPSPALEISGVGLMSCVSAQDKAESYRVCEIIRDKLGNSWADVSSWYWAAILGKTAGPWYAISVRQGSTFPTLS